MIKSVCFTGHRDIKITEGITNIMFQILDNLIANGATDFYAGGAIGFDIFAEKTVLKLKEKYPQIRLHLVLPCPPKEQTQRWNDNDKAEYGEILQLADTILVCSEHYHKDCMRKRNIKLVEYADCCVCYYNQNKSASGTGQTFRMAQKKNIPIKNIFEFI